MELAYWKFILIVIFAVILAICVLCLIGEIIKKVAGRKKANRFTNFVDGLTDFLANLLAYLT